MLNKFTFRGSSTIGTAAFESPALVPTIASPTAKSSTGTGTSCSGKPSGTGKLISKLFSPSMTGLGFFGEDGPPTSRTPGRFPLEGISV